MKLTNCRKTKIIFSSYYIPNFRPRKWINKKRKFIFINCLIFILFVLSSSNSNIYERGKELTATTTKALETWFSLASHFCVLSLMARLIQCSHLIPSISSSIPLKSSFLLQWPNLSKTSHSMLLINRRFSAAKITMSLRAGIVGLPNVGKSTLFNAVVCSFPVSPNNYVFEIVLFPLVVQVYARS